MPEYTAQQIDLELRLANAQGRLDDAFGSLEFNTEATTGALNELGKMLIGLQEHLDDHA